MRPFSIIEWRHGTPRQRLGNRSLAIPVAV